MDYERPRGELVLSPQESSAPLVLHHATTSNSAPATSTRHSSNPISSQDKLIESDTPSVTQEPPQNENAPQNHNLDQVLPPLPSVHQPSTQGWRRTRTIDTHRSMRARSVLDHVVPFDEKSIQVPPASSVEYRLGPTLKEVENQIKMYTNKARYTGYVQNIALGLQVLLGSLTTGLSAAGTTGRQTAIQTTILGGLTTIVASYLAKTRGSNEPESSLSRVKDLENFERRCKAFTLDHGSHTEHDFDAKIDQFRKEFEELLGNISGEVKRASPA